MKEIITKPAGIYIHIPFCRSKCGYCDFYSVTSLKSLKSFIPALISEINGTDKEQSENILFDTIYFGGGTPSLLSADELKRILQTLYANFHFHENTEITLEANPGTLTAAQLKAYRAMGVNRMSIGIQSFIDRELQILERIHSSDEAITIYKEARDAGFDNISIDLIFALPGQTLKNWEDNLNKAVELHPEHISAYNLIFEEGTPFYQAREERLIRSKSEAEELKFYQMTINYLNQSGYQQYEVSNYARSKELYSRHNQKYWDHTNYLGFGPSAHSYWINKRWSNVPSVMKYIQQLNNGKSPVNFREHIGPDTREFENIFLSLRTISGLNLLDFKNRFDHQFNDKYKEKAERLIESGLAEYRDQYFRLTQKGLFISDAILAEFAHN